MQKDYTWMVRTKEWKRANPGKSYVFKKYHNESDHDTDLISAEPVVVTSIIPNLPHAGVYVIICEVEKFVYVGQSKNIPSRMRAHKLAINSKSEGKAYIKIREHYNKHGIDAFEFRNYTPMPNATLTELLSEEREVMTKYVRMGYLLYNISINANINSETIYCPLELRTDISELIRIASTNQEIVLVIKDLISKS